jgi:hypothetical protein
MSDWLGLIFFAVLVAGAYLGLRHLSRPGKRTEEEFEKGAEESASLLGAGVAALQGILDPAEQRSRIEVEESRQGRYQRRSVAGKTGDDIADKENASGEMRDATNLEAQNIQRKND